MESFQKRDRNRKKIERRNAKEVRRKERAERRREGPIPVPDANGGAGAIAVTNPSAPGGAP